MIELYYSIYLHMWRRMGLLKSGIAANAAQELTAVVEHEDKGHNRD